MKISNIWVDESIRHHERVLSILDHPMMQKAYVQTIESYHHYFGRVKKPYLNKRESLDLFLAQKPAPFVKEVFNSYGKPEIGERHFYFHYSYNCPYECEYCFLQGYFKSPDLVWFLNYEDIVKEMKELCESSPDYVWFHAGEYSDSLALSHITKEWDHFIPELAKIPNAKLELRTKSSNIHSLLSGKRGNWMPHDKLFITFSLSPEDQIIAFDHGAPKLQARLKAIAMLLSDGFCVGIHLDPIIFPILSYEKLLKNMATFFSIEQISYWSVGILRFPKSSYKELLKNYPQTLLQDLQWTSRDDGKKRISIEQTQSILLSIYDLLISHKIQENKIYKCHEDNNL